MMRQKSIVVTTSGASNPIPLDRYVNGYAIAVAVKTAGAGVSWTLQQSLDNTGFDPNGNKYTVSFATSAKWFNSDDAVMVNQSASRTSNFNYPPTAIRVVASAGVSAANPLTLYINPMGAM